MELWAIKLGPVLLLNKLDTEKTPEKMNLKMSTGVSSRDLQ